MRIKRWLVILILAAGLLGGLAAAQGIGYTLPWSTSEGGGGDSSGGGYRLASTLGQADAGALSGGEYRLEGGFWGGVGAAVAPPLLRLYLPLTARP